MEGSILTRFQLDMGLASDSDSDTGPGQSWAASSNERPVQERHSEGTHSSDSDPEDDFPFTPAQRRAHSLSDEDQVPERELKRRKEFAQKTCTELGLAPDALSGFSQLQHADMFIELRASIMALKQESQKNETRKYIASEEFKDILKERLRCCLLSPNLTGYVIGMAPNILEYAKKNIATFKIPEKAIQDPEMLDSIATMVKDLLTSQRSNIKQKLANSMKLQSHISLLGRTLALGTHFEITLSHWARYAFLRSSITMFSQLVDEGKLATVTRNQSSRSTNTASDDANGPGMEAAVTGGAGAANGVAIQTSIENLKIWTYNEFWEFVDTLLSQSRAAAVAREATVQGRQKILETMFMKCLQADMKAFPPNPSQSSNPPSEKVTLPWLHNINTNLMWINP